MSIESLIGLLIIIRLIHLWHHYDNYGKQLKLNLNILNIRIEH